MGGTPAPAPGPDGHPRGDVQRRWNPRLPRSVCLDPNSELCRLLWHYGRSNRTPFSTPGGGDPFCQSFLGPLGRPFSSRQGEAGPLIGFRPSPPGWAPPTPPFSLHPPPCRLFLPQPPPPSHGTLFHANHTRAFFGPRLVQPVCPKPAGADNLGGGGSAIGTVGFYSAAISSPRE